MVKAQITGKGKGKGKGKAKAQITAEGRFAGRRQMHGHKHTQHRLNLLNQQLVNQVYAAAQVQALLYCSVCPPHVCIT